MTPEEMAAKARRAVVEEGPRAEMLVVVPGRDLPEPINVLPGVQGRFISEEPRGTVVYVSAAAVLVVLALAKALGGAGSGKGSRKCRRL